MRTSRSGSGLLLWALISVVVSGFTHKLLDSLSVKSNVAPLPSRMASGRRDSKSVEQKPSRVGTSHLGEQTAQKRHPCMFLKSDHAMPLCAQKAWAVGSKRKTTVPRSEEALEHAPESTYRRMSGAGVDKLAIHRIDDTSRRDHGQTTACVGGGIARHDVDQICRAASRKD
eukprot:6336290-Prymnesium_polylepis.1